MPIGKFEKQARIQGDKLDVRTIVGRPLLVRVMETVPDFASTAYPEPKEVVFVDVVDLMSGAIYINALWGAAAIVDGLKEQAGQDVLLPVKVVQRVSGRSGRTYQDLAALEDQELALAHAWAQANEPKIDDARRTREAAAKAAGSQPATPPSQFNAAAAAIPASAPVPAASGTDATFTDAPPAQAGAPTADEVAAMVASLNKPA